MGHLLTRRALYERVWSEPISRLSAEFGVSGPAIAKACAKMCVPVPPRGYLARLSAGKPVVRAELRPRPPGLDDEVDIGGGRYARYYRQYTVEELLGPLPPEPVFEESLEAIRARVESSVGKISVSKDFDRPHPVVSRLLQQDEERRQKLRESPYLAGFSHYAPRFDSPGERRRLRMLSALLLAAARCNCKSERWDREHGNRVQITVGHQTVTVGLRVVEHRSGAGRAGRPAAHALRCEIGPRDDNRPAEQVWEDGEHPLERQLQEVLVAVIVAGERQHRDSVLRTWRWRVERKAQLEEEIRQRRAEAERRERERLAALEQARIERLLGEAAALERARQIRRYVVEVQDAQRSAEAPIPPDALEAWCAWALAQADQIDPIRNGAYRTPYDAEAGAPMLAAAE